MQATNEYEAVSHLYVIPHPGTPEMLDWLHMSFENDRNLVERALSAGLCEAVERTLHNLYEEPEVTVVILWTSTTFTATQALMLRHVMRAVRIQDCHEPGWWLWNGGGPGICMPWGGPAPEGGAGCFARARNSEYKYPWS